MIRRGSRPDDLDAVARGRLDRRGDLLRHHRVRAVQFLQPVDRRDRRARVVGRGAPPGGQAIGGSWLRSELTERAAWDNERDNDKGQGTRDKGKRAEAIMLNWVEQFRRDVQFGVRGLARTRGFTALAVMSLALGIMATTAIYSVLHAVVLDPFPYKDVDKLMSVRVSNPAQRGCRTGYSVDQFLEIAGAQHDLRRRDRVDHQRRAVDR